MPEIFPRLHFELFFEYIPQLAEKFPADQTNGQARSDRSLPGLLLGLIMVVY